jgi:hypothetical protein
MDNSLMDDSFMDYSVKVLNFFEDICVFVFTGETEIILFLVLLYKSKFSSSTESFYYPVVRIISSSSSSLENVLPVSTIGVKSWLLVWTL